MKKVLSLLVAFVFLQVQTWALSGGPVYGSIGKTSIIGTYGGVLIPTSTTINTAAGAGGGASFQPTSIGLFSLSVPETGISVGVAIIFVQGIAFIGQVAGASNVNRQEIQGLIAGTSNFTIPPIPPATTATSIFAQGTFKAKVIEGDAGAFTPAPAGSGNGTGAAAGTAKSSTAAEIGSTNAARLQGTAQIATFSSVNGLGEPNITLTVNYSLDGIKQNNIPSNVTTVPFTFSGGGGGG